MQCAAKSKRTGEQCRKHATPGRDVCHIHGGKSPRGNKASNFKHGRHSSYLPDHLAQAYHAALEDQKLTDVGEEIALVDALIADSLSTLQAGNNAQFWSEVGDHIKSARLAIVKEVDLKRLNKSLDAINKITEERRLYFAAENALQLKIEQRRKLVETKERIALQGERAVSVQELMVFMGVVIDLINRKVPDSEQRHDILDSIDHLMAGNAGAIH